MPVDIERGFDQAGGYLMADLVYDFPINAPVEKVFAGVATPPGLDAWWTIRSSGSPRLGEEYELDFGPGYVWRAKVTRCEANADFELTMMPSDKDWMGTRVRFVLTPKGGGTNVQFSHIGWPEINEHYRISSFCWAMYLRLLKRNVEFGEVVPYAHRLDV